MTEGRDDLTRPWCERLRWWRKYVKNWSPADFYTYFEQAGHHLKEEKVRPLSEKQLWLWESGNITNPQARTRRILAHLGAPLPVPALTSQRRADALQRTSEATEGDGDDPLRVAHEWLVVDHPAKVHSAAGRRVGASLVSELERRVIELRHLDDVIGGGDLCPLVRKELSDASSVVNEASYTEETGRRLLTVVGDLAQLAGWVASDAGQYVEAQRVYLGGVSAANDAGDRALAGQLLSSLSYQIANVGEPVDAALLARSAVKGANGATPVVRALLLERVAWASARAWDRDGARRALDAVDESYEQRSAGVEEPEWVYWLDRKEIDVMAGRCLIELGDPVTAEPLLSGAIAAYMPEHAREVALYQTWLAESYARAGVFDTARDTIARARKTAHGVNSTRLDIRIGEVERLLPS